MKLYLATSNLPKIDELKKMLSEAGLNGEVHTAEAVGGMPEVIEDQDTFSGNALKKARALAALLPDDGLALADDSGICIEAFDGAPGVRAARYAGEDATDESNLDKLIREMKSIPDGQRGGAFVCHLAAVLPGGDEVVFEGEVRGLILRERKGTNGFGYDPVFYIPLKRKTFAEMSLDEKGKISHRGLALNNMLTYLKTNIV